VNCGIRFISRQQATTEAHKLPETIISRTQRFTFKPVTTEKVAAHLRSIAQTENLKIDDEALQLIAAFGEGSFRDSISLLDQVRNQNGEVTGNDVRGVLGLAPDKAIAQIIKALSTEDASDVVKTLSGLEQQGFESAAISAQLGSYIRTALLENQEFLPPQTSLKLLRALLDVPGSRDPKAMLELALLTHTFPDDTKLPRVAPKTTQTAALDANDSPINQESVEEPPKPVKSKVPPKASPVIADNELWTKVLEIIKKDRNTLYGVLRMAQPRFEKNNLELGLNDPKNQQIIAEIISELTGKQYSITSILIDQTPALETKAVEAEPPAQATRPDITPISNIFGGAELLES
jgi:DNA polymerase III gamma/tau subunit